MFPKITMNGSTLTARKRNKWQLSQKCFNSSCNTSIEMQVFGNHIQPLIHNMPYTTITKAILSTGSRFDSTINPIL